MQNKHTYVSQKEVHLTAGTVLITKTDTKGIITYTNDTFCEVAGYSREELMGENHNIVRHPDMPSQAFKWLWDTLKAELPWRGMVKNRCKNGDHYWVRATVAPVIDESGRTTGYVSVRRAPSRAEIAQAESLYRELNQSKGEVVSKFEKFKFKNWPIKVKLQTAVQIPLLIILVAAQIYIVNQMAHEMNKQAISLGEDASEQLIDSANMLMVAGQISDEATRKLLITKMTSASNIRSAAIVRSPSLVEQYGQGLPDEKVSDDMQRLAITSGEKQITLSNDAAGKPYIRIVTPYALSKNFHGTDCTSCHTGGEGAVVGASDLTIELTGMRAGIDLLERNLVIGQVVLHLLFVFLIGRIVNAFVRRPLKQVEAEFRNMMEGNLDTELDISTRDEMGSLLCKIQTMQTYLRTMIDDIVTPVSKMRAHVGSVNNKVDIVAANALSEQGQIQAIAATMEEFSHSIGEVAHMAGDSLTSMQRTRQIVHENDANMGLSISATRKVADTVKSSSKTISDLGESIQKIGVIANSIKEIADQTNLLALNAAIEAARAGEQGRGFAVVADEVRKLAERTATSTKDITGTISNITAVSNEAVKAMGNAVTEVELGIALISKNGEGLKEIMSATETMAGRIDHIAQASKEQSVAGENVAKSLEHITGLVDENARSVQSTKFATQELTKSADELSKAGYPLTKCAMKS